MSESATVGARVWARRKTIAAVVGFVVSAFVCPQLPAEWRGPCRMGAQAMRTFSFDGLPLDDGGQ